MNAKTLAILDHTDKLHVIDIRTNEELQVMTNLTECVQLVFNSCFFKSLATGGYVSKALAFNSINSNREKQTKTRERELLSNLILE